MNTEKFWSNTIPEPNSGCLLWLGPSFKPRRRSKEYGRYGKRNLLAHRVSWALTHGEAGNNMVCHSCDTPLCVNPDHLFLGDAASNMADKVSKGRQARGNKIRPTKLTEDQARYIKANPALACADIARQFGVSFGVVWNVRFGVSWKWVKL